MVTVLPLPRDGSYKQFFCSGVASCCAAFLTNPIDVIKVRLQLDNQLSGNKNIFVNRYYKGFIRGIIVIAKDEGVKGLSKGIVASVIRDGIYSTLRIGAYEPVKGLIGASHPYAPLWKKVLAGAICGGTASIIMNPTDLVKIRLQGEGKLGPGEKPQYRGTWHAFSSIVKKDGVLALWRGVGPTFQRAAILSATQMPVYDHTKNTLKQKGIMDEGLPVHIVAAFTAGLATAITTNPIDLVKTRIMNERVLSKDSLTYASTIPTFVKVYRYEGFMGFYKGFIPNWMRLGPHTIITFLIFENLRVYVGLPPV